MIFFKKKNQFVCYKFYTFTSYIDIEKDTERMFVTTSKFINTLHTITY